MNLNVTSVAKQPQAYGEAPASIEVITGDQIERSGASSIPEALRLADNLDVAQVDASKWAISARGFNSSVSDKLLVLIDGRSVYSPLFSGVIWNMQDYLMEDIDRIEVISGPGGTLWGANAVNGVINIITRNAKDTQGGFVDLGIGNQEEMAALQYGGTAGDDVALRDEMFRERASAAARAARHDDELRAVRRCHGCNLRVRFPRLRLRPAF